MNPAVIGLASAYLIGELVATPKRRHPIVRGLCVAAGGYVLIGVFSIRAAYSLHCSLERGSFWTAWRNARHHESGVIPTTMPGSGWLSELRT